MKCCSKCQKVKPLTEFYPKQRISVYPSSSAGYSSSCKDCVKGKQIDYRKRLTPEQRKAIDLRCFYGIDIPQYNRLFEQQSGRCGICKAHQSELKKALAVDHNHKTGLIRGLLCHKCNLAIGLLRVDETLSVVSNIAGYIDNFNSELAAINSSIVPIRGTKKAG